MQIEPGDRTILKSVFGNSEYHTEVCRYSGEDLIIKTPIDNGSLLRMDKDDIYDIEIHEKEGVYAAQGKAVKQTISNKDYLTKMVLTQKPVRIQRRQYYRLPCRMSARGIVICNEQSKESEDKIDRLLSRDGTPDVVDGIILNISGGGAYMTCGTDLGEAWGIILRVALKERKAGQASYVPTRYQARILEKREKESGKEWDYRLKFEFRDERERDALIRYIFREQTRSRNVV